MGNAKSSGQGTMNSSSSSSISKRQPRLEIPEDASPSSRHSSPRKGSRAANTPRLSVSSQGRKISALPLAHRQIVKGCMDKAKDDIAERIYRRVYEKRDDFRNFVEALSDEQRCELADSLRSYLRNVVEQITDGAAVQRISEDFGARHVQYRSGGFRPDFFALTADAVTTECVLLDAAVHQASDVLYAWSTLTSLMFSSVRDGYYNEQRRIRKASHGHRAKLSLPDGAVTPEIQAEEQKEGEGSATPSPYASKERIDTANLEETETSVSHPEETAAREELEFRVPTMVAVTEIVPTTTGMLTEARYLELAGQQTMPVPGEEEPENPEDPEVIPSALRPTPPTPPPSRNRTSNYLCLPEEEYR